MTGAPHHNAPLPGALQGLYISRRVPEIGATLNRPTHSLWPRLVAHTPSESSELRSNVQNRLTRGHFPQVRARTCTVIYKCVKLVSLLGDASDSEALSLQLLQQCIPAWLMRYTEILSLPLPADDVMRHPIQCSPKRSLMRWSVVLFTPSGTAVFGLILIPPAILLVRHPETQP